LLRVDDRTPLLLLLLLLAIGLGAATGGGGSNGSTYWLHNLEERSIRMKEEEVDAEEALMPTLKLTRSAAARQRGQRTSLTEPLPNPTLRQTSK
jgi:hypothetical protein